MTAIFHDLNAKQADGLMCVEETCREDFTVSRRPHVPVGKSATGSQVFACEPCAAKLCIVCGPGCCAPVLGMHMSCPGPAAGRTAVSVR